MCYNFKEKEVRQIERIEEEYMRKILNTSRGCPITQLYLEYGQYPARFEIQKRRLLYLKYILEQPEDSLIKKIFNLQISEPTRGDWAMGINMPGRFKISKNHIIPQRNTENDKISVYKSD